MSIEKRIERLERSKQVSEEQRVHTIIYRSTEEPRPTVEEIEAAKRKFLEEHPGHQGHIVLDFLHLHDGEHNDS